MKAPDGLKLLPYQEEGVTWASNRIRNNQRSLIIADEMGLGKTIQAISILNSLEWKKCLIICPASLKLNWEREVKKWLVEQRKIVLVNDGKTLPKGEITIINYDLVGKHKDIYTKFFDVIICDEAHYLKNKDANRTKFTLGIPSRYFIALTGTPILNRPIEIFTLLNRCAPREFSNWFAFAKRYCNLQKTRFGLDASGASNLDELQRRMKQTCLIRRLKKDVLKDLPAKRRQIIELPPTKEMRMTLDRENLEWSLHESTLAKLAERRDAAEIADDEESYREAAKELKKAAKVAFQAMAKVRKDTAMAKLPLCIEHIKDALQSIRKLIVFAHHIDAIESLKESLSSYNPVDVQGATSQEDRQAAVDRFQNDPECRVFIGGIRAAGVGLTLTAASNVVFVEADWTPAILSQAEDRAHRIGQQDSVLVQHLVLESSLDANMIKKVIAKQEIIDAALDNKADVKAVAINGNAPKRMNWAEIGKGINLNRREAIIKGLKIIAGLDEDNARQRNGIGFSAFHSEIGQNLAKRFSLTDSEAGYGLNLVQRYRAQLDIGILRACGLE